MTSGGDKGDTGEYVGHPRRPAFALIVPWELSYVGGVNRVVSDLYAALDRGFDFQPLVITSSWPNKRAETDHDAEERRTLRLRIRALVDNFSTSLRVVLSCVINLPLQLRAIRRLTSDQNVTVANFQYIGGHVFSWTVLRWLGMHRGAVVLSLHGSDVHDLSQFRGIVRRLGGWMIGHDKKVTVDAKIRVRKNSPEAQCHSKV